ncbi:hypothetical protein PSPTOT1_1613 [Pseudomonas syringae pv. tomato T1]|nr:hypothetical protein XJ28_02935 [Pseudomonas syringae pv. tomato]EEB61020.1 hypothetical protein PSPTOT1_1613 [Pseudomonas syringae pv. tomato T1]KGK96445.1 hypothetical protein NB04_05650 [Pseudomonas syringae pv. tomato]
MLVKNSAIPIQRAELAAATSVTHALIIQSDVAAKTQTGSTAIFQSIVAPPIHKSLFMNKNYGEWRSSAG